MSTLMLQELIRTHGRAKALDLIEAALREAVTPKPVAKRPKPPVSELPKRKPPKRTAAKPKARSKAAPRPVRPALAEVLTRPALGSIINIEPRFRGEIKPQVAMMVVPCQGQPDRFLLSSRMAPVLITREQWEALRAGEPIVACARDGTLIEDLVLVPA